MTAVNFSRKLAPVRKHAKLWLVRHGVTEQARLHEEPPFGGYQLRPAADLRCAGFAVPDAPCETRMQHDRPAAVLEGTAVARIQVALAGKSFGEHKVVAVELNVPVGDALARLLPDSSCR